MEQLQPQKKQITYDHIRKKKLRGTKGILDMILPIWSKYGIFTYICHKLMINVGKFSIPMDPMGYDPQT